MQDIEMNRRQNNYFLISRLVLFIMAKIDKLDISLSLKKTVVKRNGGSLSLGVAVLP